MEQDHPNAARQDAANRAARFLRHSALQEGCDFPLDNFRLPTQASYPGQHREAPDERHRPDCRSQVGLCERALQGIFDCWRRALARIPRAATALKSKPVLFVMMNDTEDADDVAGWLREKYPEEFGR